MTNFKHICIDAAIDEARLLLLDLADQYRTGRVVIDFNAATGLVSWEREAEDLPRVNMNDRIVDIAHILERVKHHPMYIRDKKEPMILFLCTINKGQGLIAFNDLIDKITNTTLLDYDGKNNMIAVIATEQGVPFKDRLDSAMWYVDNTGEGRTITMHIPITEGEYELMKRTHTPADLWAKEGC